MCGRYLSLRKDMMILNTQVSCHCCQYCCHESNIFTIDQFEWIFWTRSSKDWYIKHTFGLQATQASILKYFQIRTLTPIVKSQGFCVNTQKICELAYRSCLFSHQHLLSSIFTLVKHYTWESFTSNMMNELSTGHWHFSPFSFIYKHDENLCCCSLAFIS